MIGRIGLIELGIGLIELGKGLIELGIGLIELGIGLIELGIGLMELGKGLMELAIGLRIITPGAPSWPVYPALLTCLKQSGDGIRLSSHSPKKSEEMK